MTDQDLHCEAFEEAMRKQTNDAYWFAKLMRAGSEAAIRYRDEQEQGK